MRVSNGRNTMISQSLWNHLTYDKANSDDVSYITSLIESNVTKWNMLFENQCPVNFILVSYKPKLSHKWKKYFL